MEEKGGGDNEQWISICMSNAVRAAALSTLRFSSAVSGGLNRSRKASLIFSFVVGVIWRLEASRAS